MGRRNTAVGYVSRRLVAAFAICLWLVAGSMSGRGVASVTGLPAHASSAPAVAHSGLAASKPCKKGDHRVKGVCKKKKKPAPTATPVPTATTVPTPLPAGMYENPLNY